MYTTVARLGEQGIYHGPLPTALAGVRFTVNLPGPRTFQQVCNLMGPLVQGNPEKWWQAKRIGPGWFVNVVMKTPVKLTDPDYDLLNRYLFFRACNQANEACNKLWAVCDLYHHAVQVMNQRATPLSSAFDYNFLPSSTVPTL